MGTLYFSETNNLNSPKTEFVAEKCQLNNNLDVVKSEKENHLEPVCPSQQKQRKKCQCGTVPLVVSGAILLTLGLLSIKFTFTDIILNERLKMHPGYPPYDLWLNPQPEIRLNVYIFAVENAEKFLKGEDSKLKIKEIGPIAYREYLQHRDVVFHDNSTLSYTAFRWAEFLPHANQPGILNKTITVPNFAILAAASFVNEKNYLLQVGYNLIHRKHNDGLFINITIYDYLWNYKSKFLKKLHDFAPSMVPTLNSGVLHTMYTDSADRYNVKIGTKYGDSHFFQINTVNGAPTVPGYDMKKKDCYASVENSTEGAMYRQRITKSTVLSFWRKALCRTVSLHFEKEVQFDDILTNKYTLGPNMYDRKRDNETDCYKGTYGVLPNGLTDISKCYFNLPFAASQPHFHGRYDGITKKFEGLNPKEQNHSSFTIVYPNMGVPVNQAARSQMNLIIPNLSYFFSKDYQPFSDMILPIFWLEFVQKDLTPEMVSMVGFFANVLPIIEIALTCTLICLAFTLFLIAFIRLLRSKWSDLTKTYPIDFKFAQRNTGIGVKCDSFK